MSVADQHGQGVKTALLIHFYKIVLDVGYTTIPKLFWNEGANIGPRGIKVAALVISAIGRTHHLLRVRTGWTSRLHFEEVWMALLGVLSATPIGPELLGCFVQVSHPSISRVITVGGLDDGGARDGEHDGDRVSHRVAPAHAVATRTRESRQVAVCDQASTIPIRLPRHQVGFFLFVMR